MTSASPAASPDGSSAFYGQPELSARAAPPPPPPDELDTSIFPGPPAFYHRYTSANLALPLDATISEVPGEPRPFQRSEMEPPNVDWIVQEGNYSVFGETWPVDEKVPTLEEMGVQEMFDRTADRKQSLQTLLRALLLTYTQLLDALLAPPPSLAHPLPPLPDGRPAPTDSERLSEHMRLIAINMHYLVNELRPVQARETLKAMMRAQIDLRRAKTAAIKQKCVEIQTTLASLRTSISNASTPADELEKSAAASTGNSTLATADEAFDILAKLQARADALTQ
ncbi:mediator of RNA polymerase II transcription subunit 7 [Rhodotorula toruloides]|uniref:Mediator of RNA polymerase II transcription subunit 7 n=1 Tax=Rhodotorula toruloides TaxID=5286 RepID=A0A511KM92_RHOTO|nr:mediator of RNA polymerase II transcription subunit 7 [Rhodotorula toruloides]